MRVYVERPYSRGARHARACALGLSLGLAFSACSHDPTTAPPTRQRGIGPATAPVQQPPSNNEGYGEALVVQAPTAAAAEPPPTAAQPEDKPARDFSAELVQGLGSPAACLKPRTDETAPSSIDITLATSVMPSGAVAQSDVRGTGLDPSETSCLRARLETVHFALPIENAPMKVSASLHLTRATAIAPQLGAAEKKSEPQAYAAPAAAAAQQPAANDLNLGNPEVGAPPLNAPDPP